MGRERDTSRARLHILAEPNQGVISDVWVIQEGFSRGMMAALRGLDPTASLHVVPKPLHEGARRQWLCFDPHHDATRCFLRSLDDTDAFTFGISQ